MQEQATKDNYSGTVRIQDGKIFWDVDNKNILELDINEVVVVGEYSNSDGPYFDDLFLTFVTKEQQWHSIPWYADNINEVTQYLSDKFHQDLNETRLANSTEWKSIVRYPLHLEGKALFILTPSDTYKVPKTFIDKIFSSVGFDGFDTTQNIALTEEVKNEVTNASR
jgi:hypothetical protein